MSEAKIAAFYDDPLKQACDAWSVRKAWHFKSVSVGTGPMWLAQRWGRFGVSLSRGLRHRLAGANAPTGSHASSSSSSSLSPSA